MARHGQDETPKTLEEALSLIATLHSTLDEHVATIDEHVATIDEHVATITDRDAIISEHVDAIRVRDEKILELRHLLAKQFGPSSERLSKLSDADLLLFKDLIDAEQAAADKRAAEGEETVEVKKHKRRRNGRKLIPDDLPRETVVHDLTSEERSCPCCGAERVEIGRDVTETVDFVPASVKVKRHERVKYACPECAGQIAIADPPPLPFDRSKAEAGMLAVIAVSKYADHAPLYRQEAIFKRFGIDVPRSTQCDWMARTAETLDPLAKRMRELVRTSRIIQTDDTPVKLRDGPRSGERTARFWAYVGDRDHPYVIYDFSCDRRGEHPQRWLAGCSGYLQCDAFAGYDAVFAQGGLVEVGCWAHVRRKFHDARLTDPGRALPMVKMIGELYEVEKAWRALPERERTFEHRLAMRDERSRAHVDAIMEVLRGWRDATMPKSAIGKAVRYALGLETALRRYLGDGALEIDNNACERALRGIALGRKNWLFAGSERGGRTAATIFTVLASARLHEIEPWAYLRDVLDRMPHVPISQLDDFLPDVWKRAHPEAHLALNR
jgi:transposase